MKCPVCNVDLLMSERSGVEIDYCPKCRGVWLDRGELDEIIRQSGAAAPREFSSPQHFEETRSRYDEHGHGHGHDHDHERHHDQGRKKKENFLGDLFDF